ncbi:hypothetical protein IG631_12799 [Alternaria alternata]|nr:hypothetical protein IG631_12799 [Alternaria alternata]
MQEHKTNMQHRSISIMRCLCKSTYRPPDIPLRDGDTMRIPGATIRNLVDSEAVERCVKAGGIELRRRGHWEIQWKARRGLTRNHRLINEASIKSKQRGERALSARSVKRVSEDVLRKYKG